MRCFAAVVVLALLPASLYAQSEAVAIPMTTDRWQAEPGRITFMTHKGVPAMRVQAPGEGELFTGAAQAVLEDVNFSDGTIEFDLEITDFFLVGIYFRRTDADNGEIFYLRTHRTDDPTGVDAVQYTVLTQGAALWDLHPHFQGAALLKKNDWNRIKLVLSGQQMYVYVNNPDEPVLVVPNLAGDASSGSIAFEGGGIFANLVITPGATEGVSPVPGFDPTQQDPRYLRNWQVSAPIDLPLGQELVSVNGFALHGDALPSESIAWEPIKAEYGSLVNLSRRFGKTENRRAVWLKQTLTVETDQVRYINLGFSDEVWVVLNGQLVFVDKNAYGHPIMKDPFGQISTEDARFALPLRAGENELLIGLANSFFGWAIIAKIDQIDGVTIEQ
ncbi:MAG: hypothetical protein RhofKO_14070 [Rhodothermales bacterium]